MEYAIKHEKQVVTASGLVAVAAAWLLCSPFLLGFNSVHSAYANDMLFGLLIGFFALCRFFGPASDVGMSWLNALFGLWVLASPWLLRFAAHHHAAMLSNVLTGIAITALACWSAIATMISPEPREVERRSDAFL